MKNGPAMSCPDCGHRISKITDKRNLPDRIRRRRECLQCGHRWTTYEAELADVIQPPPTQHPAVAYAMKNLPAQLLGPHAAAWSTFRSLFQ